MVEMCYEMYNYSGQETWRGPDVMGQNYTVYSSLTTDSN